MAGVKIAVLATILSACATTPPADRPSPPGSGPASASAPPAAGPTLPPPTTGSGASAVRVVLTRSGGFAGRGDTLTVEPDGRWTAVDRAGSRRTGRLSDADLDRLRRLVADPALAAEAGSPPAGTACQDAYSYQLTVGAVRATHVDCPADGAAPTKTRAAVELLMAATG
ncbi:hypothetical protein [Micromonospora sp. KLBMP9576]|uniref:hypothetical protein n=1 Tax=Micromonospora sp. KLBMP9576 TaxID=3424769 RepID=UPI003D929278